MVLGDLRGIYNMISLCHPSDGPCRHDVASGGSQSNVLRPRKVNLKCDPLGRDFRNDGNGTCKDWEQHRNVKGNPIVSTRTKSSLKKK